MKKGLPEDLALELGASRQASRSSRGEDGVGGTWLKKREQTLSKWRKASTGETQREWLR